MHDTGAIGLADILPRHRTARRRFVHLLLDRQIVERAAVMQPHQRRARQLFQNLANQWGRSAEATDAFGENDDIALALELARK